MNGGTCEATPFNLHQIKAAGLAVPLGNYHNQRPDGKPGPEYINLKDVESAVLLCVEFFKRMENGKDPMKEYVIQLSKEFRRDAKLLKQKISFVERTDPVAQQKGFLR